jgi:hypothetical protein
LGTTGRNAPPGDDPDLSRSIIDFVGAVSENAITIGHSAHNGYLFVPITSGVRIDSSNVCLTGTGGKEKCPGQKSEEDRGFSY